jgi:hypothetical protein
MQLAGKDYIQAHLKDGNFESKIDNFSFSLKENVDFYYDGFKTRTD